MILKMKHKSPCSRGIRRLVVDFGFRFVNISTYTTTEFAFLLKISNNWQCFVKSVCYGGEEVKAWR